MDKFRQMIYKVYLRYTPETSTVQSPFYLQYGSLKIVAGLDMSSSSGVTYSHIDVSATKDCYVGGPGANWDDNKVIFKINEDQQTVEIDFMNESPGLPCGTPGQDAILFNWGAPQGISVQNCPSQYGCAYAELFTIIVNAYPEESIRVRPQVSEFYPPDPDEGQQVCNPVPVENGNISYNGITWLTTSPAADPTGTNNTNMALELPNPTTVNGKQYFEVRIRNNGTQALTISYLEFLIKASSSKAISLSFSGNHLPRDPKVAGNDRYIHYMASIANGITVGAGQTYAVGTIEVGPPNPINQGWTVTVTWSDENKSRLKTTTACTRLPAPQIPVSNSYTTSGTALCTNSPVFKVRAKDGVFDPCAATPAIVQAGLEVPSGQMNISRFSCEIEFELTGSLAISGINFDDWLSGWTCPTQLSSCVPPGSDDPCYDIVGSNVIKFCFVTLGANPITFGTSAFINIQFNNAPGCITKATIKHLELTMYGGTPCIPLIENTLANGISDCPPQIKGTIATETSVGVEDVNVALSLHTNPTSCQQDPICAGSSPPSTCSQQTGFTANTGDYGFCTCEECNCFIVTPAKNDNPLNGVSTFDLVLISKHILGIQSLGSPYKMIAADANKSNSVTTFDITEIRKLILGISSQFPANTSWRFVDADFSFPNPSNPFQTTFPENRKNIDAQNPGKVNFVGVKIGDVNDTAIPNRPGERPVATLTWAAQRAELGSTVTVPIIYSGLEPLEAIQLGLRFDPAKLRLLGPSQGNLPGYHADNFGLTKAQEGEIRTLWLASDPDDPKFRIAPGAVLFHLTFQVLEALPETSLPLWLDDAVLANAAWKSDGTEYVIGQEPLHLEHRESPQATTLLRASVQPNPASGAAVFKVQAAQAGKGRIALFGPFGSRIFIRDVRLDVGEQEFSVPEVAQLPAGIYIWKVYVNGEKAQGHLVKQ